VAFLTAKETQQLPEPLRRNLPADWKSYVNGSSNWPVLFGVYRQDDHWDSFIASPVWNVPKTDKTHVTKAGLITFVADTDSGETWGKSYLGFLEKRGFGGSAFGADIQGFFSATSDDPKTWTWFKADQGLIRSDMAFPASHANAMPAADVALRLEPGDGKEALAASIPDLPDAQRLEKLPPMSEVAIRFGDSGPTLVRLSFEQNLTEQDASLLLGAYGFTMRKQITLPDGTLSYERIEPTATSGTSLLGERKDDQGRVADIQDNLFVLHSASSSGELPLAPSCAGGTPWLRLSEDTVSAVAKQLGIKLEPDDVRPVQLVSDHGKLVACFE
ncbi:MAG TPA: hypothetical protein VMU11_00530, partial [Verrucomicrobiae bacterium]|nr:hypothetical protein [Verrucomicrobiae bacterium]